MKKYFGCAIIICCLLVIAAAVKSQTVQLNNDSIKLQWGRTAQGWQLQQAAVNNNGQWLQLDGALGAYTFLYDSVAPSTQPVKLFDKAGKPLGFPEPIYTYMTDKWEEITSPVSLNRAGEANRFYPSTAKKENGKLEFQYENRYSQYTASWSIAPRYPNDICVHLRLTAKQDGYYSLASPALCRIDPHQLEWATIPGIFQGRHIEPDFVKSYAYGWGIPNLPVVVRERTAAALTSIATTNKGISVAVIAEPGTGRDPFELDTNTHRNWQLGLSLMTRDSIVTPVAWHPVLGQKGSYLKKGEQTSFCFRYHLRKASWYPVYQHVVNDVYRFPDFLALKQTRQSLTDRILAMHRYVLNDSTSRWRTAIVGEQTIGAQDYLGGVYGSQHDAMKNSDYGAMWMLANIMDDSLLKTTRLPYARNFKLAQQQTGNAFFKDAAAGQYFLYKSSRFTEEWGPYSEPIALTYYMLMDMGNMLLFEPHDTILRNRIGLAADRLLSWMQPDGSWAVAYDNGSTKELFKELKDLRPTFYGFIVAYKTLHDPKYLQAAEKGASWYIANAVNEGHFLGVCGDNRFTGDFATAQSVQALLELYELTKKRNYLDAAIRTAQFYTTSIYTHPIPSVKEKFVNGQSRPDWAISQAGLCYEHGGTMGSANRGGPILLASHAGLFVRLFSITNDSLYLNMARAAALGRDAFVDPKTSVMSYYWGAMNRGPGSFPHHAWWQIGWITDYLLSEANMRSNGKIVFPQGFITPKVGPHTTYGFAPGTIYGGQAHLLLKEGLVETGSPYIDYYCASDRKTNKLYIILLNNDDEPRTAGIQLNYDKVVRNKRIKPVKATMLETKQAFATSGTGSVKLPAYGIRTIEVDFIMLY